MFNSIGGKIIRPVGSSISRRSPSLFTSKRVSYNAASEVQTSYGSEQKAKFLIQPSSAGLPFEGTRTTSPSTISFDGLPTFSIIEAICKTLNWFSRKPLAEQAGGSGGDYYKPNFEFFDGEDEAIGDSKDIFLSTSVELLKAVIDGTIKKIGDDISKDDKSEKAEKLSSLKDIWAVIKPFLGRKVKRKNTFEFKRLSHNISIASDVMTLKGSNGFEILTSRTTSKNPTIEGANQYSKNIISDYVDKWSKPKDPKPTTDKESRLPHSSPGYETNSTSFYRNSYINDQGYDNNELFSKENNKTDNNRLLFEIFDYNALREEVDELYSEILCINDEIEKLTVLLYYFGQFDVAEIIFLIESYIMNLLIEIDYLADRINQLYILLMNE